MTFTITPEIAIYLTLVVAGLCCAILNVRHAINVYRAVLVRHAYPDVVEDSRHIVTHQLQLVAGWVIFAATGVLAIVDPESATPRPLTPFGVAILIGLIGAVGVWAVKTITDYIYTRHVDARERGRIIESEPLSRAEKQSTANEAQRVISQELNAAQLDNIAATGDDTLTRVIRVEAATVTTDHVVAQHTSQTDDRLDALEALVDPDPDAQDKTAAP